MYGGGGGGGGGKGVSGCVCLYPGMYSSCLGDGY